MTRSQQYNADTAIEQIAAQFLDENFYPIFTKKAEVKRYTDTYHQFGGIDVSISTLNFDEKAKYKGCLNDVAQYVGFECSILNRAGKIQDGWFMNQSLSTDYYAIISLSATTDDESKLSSVDQISAADVLWVKKQDVLDFIHWSIDAQDLANDISSIRETNNKIEKDENGWYSLMPDCLGYSKAYNGKYRTKYDHGNFWLTYSYDMHEQPVNIVLRRSTLESCLKHTKHFIVTKGKVNII